MFKSFTKNFLVILALLLSSSLFADNYIEIGNGTYSNASQPIYSSWKYSWSGQIYPQVALGGAKTITKIAYNCVNGPKNVTNQKFYLKNSTLTIFPDANYESPETNGYTKVFEGNISFVNGWNEITLTTPFVYNGGSLIVFNENRWGQEYGPNFMSTPTTINNNKSCGGNAWPGNTGTGYLNPYPSTLANIRIYYTSTEPATPDNFVPAANTKKVKVDSAFTFTLGANTTNYDLYMSADSSAVATQNVTAKVVNAQTALNGTNSYTPTTNLLGRTVYFWRVIAKNSTQSTVGPVLKFRTQQIINQFPYFEGFESFNAPAYPGAIPTSQTIDGNYPMEVEWSYPTSPMVWKNDYTDSLKAHGGKRRAKADIFSTGQNMSHNLMTPRMYLPANQRAEFWWKNHTFGQKTAGYDSTFFEITTNGGISWTKLAFLSPDSIEIGYKKCTVSLASYSGNNVYLRWRFKTPANWSDCKMVSLDDISIIPIPSGAVIELSNNTIDYQPIAIGGKLKKAIKVTNSGTAVLNVTSATIAAPFSCTFNKSIQPSQSDTAWVYFAPTTMNSFSQQLIFNSNATSGNSIVALSGSSTGLAETVSEYFDISTSLPAEWFKIKSATDTYTDVTIQGGAGFNGSNAVKMLMLNDTISPLILVTPGVKNFAQNKLKFKSYNYSTKPINIIVGLMDNPYDATSFTPVQTISLPIQSTSIYADYEVVFNAANIKPYIAFKFGHVKGGAVSLRLDNVSWEAGGVPPSPVTPVSPVSINDVSVKPTLTWAPGTGNPTNFKVYMGTSESTMTMVSDQVTTSYIVTSPLTVGTDYFWKVVPRNAFGECTSGNSVVQFRTLDDPTINGEIGSSEGFDELVQTPGSTVPLGWATEVGAAQSGSWDLMTPASADDAFTPPKCMNVGPSFNKKDCWLITPPISMIAGKTYNLSYWYKNKAIGSETESMEVKIGKETGAVLSHQNSTVLTTLLNNHENISSGIYENGIIEYIAPETGKYYLGFHATSSENNFVLFLDQIEFSLGIDDANTPIATALNQNYPNPFNPETKISFSLASSQDITINVHNVKGELVRTLVKGNLTAGIHNINFNANDLPSGIYFCKMQSAGFLKVMKMNLIK